MNLSKGCSALSEWAIKINDLEYEYIQNYNDKDFVGILIFFADFQNYSWENLSKNKLLNRLPQLSSDEIIF